MVPHFGKNSCKMFIKGKPVRFSFKIWYLCSMGGYLFYSFLYAGANKDYSKTKMELGLGGVYVVIRHSETCHTIYFLTTLHQLFVKLKEKRFFAQEQ